MKLLQITTGLLFIPLSFLIGMYCGAISKEDEIINLRINNGILHDYKRIYMEHLEKCDSLHKGCYKVKED